MASSKTTISGDDKTSEARDYEITIKVKVTAYNGDKLHPAIGAMMNNVLNDWREGRYPFFVEQMHEGLEATFKNALYAAFQRDCQEEFGTERVKIDETSRRSRWIIAADNQMKKFNMPYFHTDWKAKIEQTDHE